LNNSKSSAKKALFFVSKPQELLGAIEAREQFGISESTLLYSSKPGIDKDTIEYLIEKAGNWHNILFVKPKPYYGYFWVSLLKKLKKEHYNYLFTRAFSASAYPIHNLNYDEHILLDDGAATINISKEFEAEGNLTKRFSLFKGLNKEGFKYRTISWLYSLFGISVEKDLKTISFFTFYNIPEVTNQTIYKNEMKWLHSQKSEGALKTIDDRVFVVGTDFCGAKILTPEQYLEELKRIKAQYLNKILVYIPHPRETSEFMDKLKELGFEIRINNFNIELDFLLSNELPTHITGTISTALITLKLIYGNSIKVDYLTINYDNVSKAHEDRLKNVYAYQKNYLTQVIP